MKVSIVPFYIALLFSGISSTLEAQENQLTISVSSEPAKTSSHYYSDYYANIYLYYPLEKSTTSYTIFLNKKNIGKISNGGRIECRLLLEGPVAITVIDGTTYKEPLTQSKNSRTISITKGKSYYFRVNGSGGLDYIFNAEKGQTHFTEEKEFIAQPASFVETTAMNVPPLQAKSN